MDIGPESPPFIAVPVRDPFRAAPTPPPDTQPAAPVEPVEPVPVKQVA
jgi:hypothetical protein